jgi:hypothetical protein
VGTHMFGLQDDLPTEGLSLYIVENNQMAELLGRDKPAISNCHMTGNFNQHSAVFAPFRDRIRGFLEPKGVFAEAAARFLDWLDAPGGPVVALHLRRGDFGYGKFWIAPEQWYLNWLEELRSTLPAAASTLPRRPLRGRPSPASSQYLRATAGGSWRFNSTSISSPSRTRTPSASRQARSRSSPPCSIRVRVLQSVPTRGGGDCVRRPWYATSCWKKCARGNGRMLCRGSGIRFIRFSHT